MVLEEEMFNKEVDKADKRNGRMDLFTSLKVKCLEKAKSVSEYNEIKNCLNGIDEETLHDDTKLKKYAIQVMTPYMTKKEKKEIEISVSEKDEKEI